MRKKFEQWAKEFILITQDDINSFDTKGMSLDDAKMEFSYIHQQAFEDSWAIRRAKILPMENEAKDFPWTSRQECFGYGCPKYTEAHDIEYGNYGTGDQEGLGRGDFGSVYGHWACTGYLKYGYYHKSEYEGINCNGRGFGDGYGEKHDPYGGSYILPGEEIGFGMGYETYGDSWVYGEGSGGLIGIEEEYGFGEGFYIPIENMYL